MRGLSNGPGEKEGSLAARDASTTREESEDRDYDQRNGSIVKVWVSHGYTLRACIDVSFPGGRDRSATFSLSSRSV